jgi:hypothetical protein
MAVISFMIQAPELCYDQMVIVRKGRVEQETVLCNHFSVATWKRIAKWVNILQDRIYSKIKSIHLNGICFFVDKMVAHRYKIGLAYSFNIFILQTGWDLLVLGYDFFILDSP